MINGTLNGTIKLSETATLFAAMFSDEIFLCKRCLHKLLRQICGEYDLEFVQQVVAQIPWGLNIVILDKITDKSIRRWYIEKTIEKGLSRNVLVHQRIFFEKYV